MTRRQFRYGSLILLFCLAAIAVLFRYASLAARGVESAGAAAPAALPRGEILDRTGRVLAMDADLYNVAVWRPETDRVAFPQEADRLAALVGASPDSLRERWSEGESDFFYVKKRVGPSLARAVEEAKAEGALSGVVVERIAGRLYPEKRLASHLLGFVGDGNRGLAGIESRYDAELLPLKPGTATEASRLILTIDAELQFSLEELARRAREETRAESVILLAGDARTGELLAYVGMPDFDPNEYWASPESSWTDFPSVYAYEPGSVFKVFTMASVLDLGGISRESSFVCDGAYRHTTAEGQTITIKDLGVHGTVHLAEILSLSCNSGAGQAADRVPALEFYERLRAFGFGARTGIALAGESPGALRSPEEWSKRSQPTIAMGQEVLVTAVQMLAAATAVANGGILRKPIAVRKIVGGDGSTVYEDEPRDVRRIMGAETSRVILAAMEEASGEAGTGRRAKVGDIRMAVKTGTAQMIDPDTRRYSESDYIASTLAILPAEAPRLVLYLAIVKPRGELYYGGRIAAPYVKEAAEIALRLMDLPRGETPTLVHAGAISLPPLESASIGETMPDLAGMPKRLLLPLLQRRDISVRLEGDGYVWRQSPAPGTAVAPGAAVLLELK
jgi:cell division protein FtsI (penicillin-binding protein 3)